MSSLLYCRVPIYRRYCAARQPRAEGPAVGAAVGEGEHRAVRRMSGEGDHRGGRSRRRQRPLPPAVRAAEKWYFRKVKNDDLVLPLLYSTVLTL